MFWGNFSRFSWDFHVFRRVQYEIFSAPQTPRKFFGLPPPTPLRGPKSYPPGVPKIGRPGGAKIFRPPLPPTPGARYGSMITRLESVPCEETDLSQTQIHART